MKFFAILACMIPFALMGQSVTAYEQVMKKFEKFYNAGKGDSINAMFQRDDTYMAMHTIWTNASVAEIMNEYGKLQSFKFIGTDTSDPKKVHVFQTVFSKKGVNTTSLTLHKNNKLGTFRLTTTSDEIARLLKNSKSRLP